MVKFSVSEVIFKVNKYYKNLSESLTQIRKKTDFIPEVGVVLGSGLGNFADKIISVKIIDYSEIKGFPISTNKMHKGRFVFGYIDDIPVVAMQGRIHYYEGYSMEQVVMPIRLMHMMGVKKLILTNAAGGINNNFSPGNLMAITDHITSFVPSPLIGENIEELGTRFPDMTNVYNKDLTTVLKNTAKDLSIDLKEGVYLQVTGPNYETPAEINAYKILGVDAVGMSTACEAMAAAHCGMKVCGISCITNMAAGITGRPLSDKEVGDVASMASDNFSRLLYNTIISI